MIYQVAICDNDVMRRDKLVEMIHVFENEYDRRFKLCDYQEVEDLIRDLDNKTYHMIFINILQAGNPADLDYAQDIHAKNPNALFLSLCPEGYKYYHDIVKEFAIFRGWLLYVQLKQAMYRGVKQIDITGSSEESNHRYVKIELKRKTEYVEINRILYIERSKNYTAVHTLDSSFYSYTVCQELWHEVQVRSNQFIRTEKEYWINFHLLYGMEAIPGVKRLFGESKSQYYAVMVGYIQVPVEEKKYEILLKRFMNEVIHKPQGS